MCKMGTKLKSFGAARNTLNHSALFPARFQAPDSIVNTGLLQTQRLSTAEAFEMSLYFLSRTTFLNCPLCVLTVHLTVVSVDRELSLLFNLYQGPRNIPPADSSTTDFCFFSFAYVGFSPPLAMGRMGVSEKLQLPWYGLLDILLLLEHGDLGT